MGEAPKAGKGAPEHPGIKIGDVVLDRYRVAEQIASGGHSVVYRGTDERLSRPVCIKVFSGLGGQSGVGRTSYEHFVQEAFALSRLTHPNTLRIFDFGHLGKRGGEGPDKDAAGMPLQVCEYMNGGTLSNIVREQGKQTVAETSRVIGAMCAALSEAHALGIVHRDIKPQNILFGTVGTDKLPKLADFGIAKWSDDHEDKSSQRAEDTAIVAGQKLAMYSPSWAAPEQLAGQPVSAATDIYSLAAVAVYMLSAKAIFADEDVYAGYKKRRHADELVRDALRPLFIAQNVIDLLTRALAFDPKKRVLKVDQLGSELAATVDRHDDRRLPLPPSRDEVTTSLRGGQVIEIEPLTPPSTHMAVTPPTGTHVTPPPPPSPTEPPVVRPAAAPTPPVIPPHAPYTSLPQARSPWMQQGVAQSGNQHRLPLSDHATIVGDRRVHFVMVTTSVVDIVGPQNSKLRVSLMMAPSGGRMLHIKGMTCFVAHLGGRPSPALQLEQPGDLALVTPRAQEIGHVRVMTVGTPSMGSTMFQLGGEVVAVSLDDCMDPILFDFGPGSDAYFLYTRGRSLPKPRR